MSHQQLISFGLLDITLPVNTEMVLVDCNFLFRFHFIIHRLDDKLEAKQQIAVNEYHLNVSTTCEKCVCVCVRACLAGTMKRILNVCPLNVATHFYLTTEGGDAEETPVSHIAVTHFEFLAPKLFIGFQQVRSWDILWNCLKVNEKVLCQVCHCFCYLSQAGSLICWKSKTWWQLLRKRGGVVDVSEILCAKKFSWLVKRNPVVK